MVHCVNS